MGVPKVSVVIPNYNHAQYLEQRIESVLRQTFTDFEVIILDDHSTDNSREIISKYASNEKVAAVIFNEENSGTPFKQWQRGVNIARGEWVWIAESDDYSDSHFLEEMIGISGIYPQAGLVYCDSRILDKDNSVADDTFSALKNMHFSTDKWSYSHGNNGIHEIEKYLLRFGTINNTSAVLFNKSILLTANPFDQDFRYIGDKYAFVKVLARSDIAYLGRALNFYRDPFNSKHANKFIYYFYEQFLVFDWVYRNIRISNKKEFLEAFYINTRNSLFRSWNREKVLIYWKLWKRNRYLIGKNMMFNFMEAVRSICRRIIP